MGRSPASPKFLGPARIHYEKQPNLAWQYVMKFFTLLTTNMLARDLFVVANFLVIGLSVDRKTERNAYSLHVCFVSISELLYVSNSFFTTMNTAWICRLSVRLPRKLKEGKLISALIGKRPFFFLIERQHMPVMDADRDIVLPLLSVRLSVHCRYGVKKNGHIVTVFDLQAGASFYFF